jgi:hypothetical protein
MSALFDVKCKKRKALLLFVTLAPGGQRNRSRSRSVLKISSFAALAARRCLQLHIPCSLLCSAEHISPARLSTGSGGSSLPFCHRQIFPAAKKCQCQCESSEYLFANDFHFASPHSPDPRSPPHCLYSLSPALQILPLKRDLPNAQLSVAVLAS